MRLPDVSITDKNDTFHLHGESCSTFRLMAQAVTRDLFGKAVPLPIPPAISGKFVVSCVFRAADSLLYASRCRSFRTQQFS